jgi:hypothetical protein
MGNGREKRLMTPFWRRSRCASTRNVRQVRQRHWRLEACLGSIPGVSRPVQSHCLQEQYQVNTSIDTCFAEDALGELVAFRRELLNNVLKPKAGAIFTSLLQFRRSC